MKKIEWTWSKGYENFVDSDFDLQNWFDQIYFNKHDWVKSQPPNLWKKALQKTAELYFNYKPKSLINIIKETIFASYQNKQVLEYDLFLISTVLIYCLIFLFSKKKG